MRSASDVARKVAVSALAAHLVWEGTTLLRARQTARTALRRPGTPPTVPATAPAVVHLLVPGLREQPYVPRTVAAFTAVRDAYPHAYIWFVTTAREEGGPDAEPTTRELLEKELGAQDASRMAVIEDPRPVGNKASQLNWAVEHIDRISEVDERRAWIGVFDFDSQPPADLAAWVAATADGPDEEPDVIQAVPVGTQCLAGPPASAAARAVIYSEALHQAVRSLGVERWKLDRATTGRRMPQYLVGAGMFLRRDVLRTAGGFPYVDDVPLGYRLFLHQARFTTVPVLNRVDLPDTVSAHLTSLKFIARGITSWPGVLRDSRRHRSVRALDRIRLAGLGITDTAEITVLPWLGAALTPYLLRSGWRGRALAAAWWALPPLQSAVMCRLLADKLDAATWNVSPGALAGTSVGRRFWRTLGAWRLAGDAVRAAVSGQTIAYGKATRSAAPAGAVEGR
ncbi:glycosyltransferase [Streptomyces sp. TRM66268-LWL]|uniref:Glycosyltransferase n=1 Tax=Streptomyces polyasparticus TaxID=2767826 RepID=A0ABR7ST93_9ACTN|nr:glycosyltransferase [Streptomyces polyasparticus]MBC9717999.1 glycosyltransferase [Streptomyces polyasparticus]